MWLQAPDTAVVRAPTEHSPSPAEPELVEDVWLHRYITLVGFLLLGYLLFDKAFAWLHIPGTPIFVGELVLMIGITGLLTTRVRIGSIITTFRATAPVLLFMAWGLVVFASGVGTYDIDALRDSTTWSYGAFTILLLAGLSLRRLEGWLLWYERLLPWIVAWLPLALAADALWASGGPTVPDSQTSIFSHWSANVTIHSFAALAFMWCGWPLGSRLRSVRVPLSSIAVLTILVSGVASRSGILSACVGGAVFLLGAPRVRSRLIWLVVAVLLSILATVVLFDFRFNLFPNQREVSAAQLMDNVVSIVSPEGADESLRGTSDWRTGFWGRVIGDVISDRPVTGYGLGPNIRDIYGEQDEDPPARNPHNSHVTIISRLGLVGGALWATLWITWFVGLQKARGRFRDAGSDGASGLALWLMVVATMYLVNGMFNEVIEGPHSAVWLWIVLGVGIFMSASSAGYSSPARREMRV